MHKSCCPSLIGPRWLAPPSKTAERRPSQRAAWHTRGALCVECRTMASHLYRELALNVVLHSLAGGLTDTVAVWMLFNPHKPFLGVQGAIPKNKAPASGLSTHDSNTVPSPFLFATATF